MKVISFQVQTCKRNEMMNIDHNLRQALQDLTAGDGVMTVYCPHTTAAITINENADPTVCSDMLESLSNMVPHMQSHFRHGEGNSDSHIKSSMLGASEQVIVQNGKMLLGTWQSVFFAEFDGPRNRTVHVTITD